MSIHARLMFTAIAFLLASGCGKKEEAPPPRQSAIDVVCSYAPSQSAIVGHIAGAAGGAGAAAAAIGKAAGLTAVLHSSGAYIFTGSGGYLAGTLGTAVAGPVLIGVGVVLGGSAATVELICAPQNHPDFVQKVNQAAKDFYARGKANIPPVVDAIQPLAAELKKSAIKTGEDALEYANRKSVDVAAVFKQR